LRCGECGTPVNPWGFIGFCADCGLPLCENCATTDHKVTSIRNVRVLPLIIVNRFEMETMDAAVTLGRKCKARLDRDENIELVAGISTAVMAFALFFLATPYLGVTENGCLPVCSSLIVAFVVLIATSVLVSSGRKHEIGPFCPVCGREAMPVLEQAAKSGVNDHYLSRVYRCTCGYAGPRLPYDGLWKFVDANGPSLFDGTPCQSAARHSWEHRHGSRRI
jgi:hypothetical protein